MSETGTPSTNPDETSCFGLPRSTRVLAYYVQSIVGIGLIVLSFLGSPFLIPGVLLLFTSSLWTNPPKEYIKQLINPVRLVSFIVLVASLVLYWIFDSWYIKYVLIGSCFWYFLSFIPGGQEWCKNCVSGCCNNCLKTDGKNENLV